jgi:hypothetical protein
MEEPNSMDISESILKVFGLLTPEDEYYKRLWGTDVAYIADHVGIHKVYDEVTDRVRLEIVIDSQTDKQDVLLVWDVIQKQLAAVVEAQGEDLNDYLRVALYAIEKGGYEKMIRAKNIPAGFQDGYQVERIKPEYRDILMDANFDILVYVIRAAKWTKDPDRAKIAYHFLKNLWTLYAGRKKIADVESEIAEWSNAAFDELAQGYCPNDIYDGPVTMSLLTNKFEYLMARYREMEETPTSKIKLLEVYKMFLIWGDWDEAASLLRKDYPKTYEKYKPRLDARLSELLIFSP